MTNAALAGGSHWIGSSGSQGGVSDRIRVAIIGMGGRGRDHMLQLAKIPGVEIAAICDPDQLQMAQKAAELEALTGKKPALQQDLRRVLEDSSIDAVTVANCNHWHALTTIWACQAGKHVYVEKPACHDLFEGAQMVAASRKYNRLVQGGTQRRSSLRIQRAIRALREGVIGDVYMARCIHYQRRDSLGFKPPEAPPSTLNWDLWVGPAPMQSFHRNLVHYNWHWFWDFGGGELANNGVHFLDIARLGLNKTLPSRIHSSGGRFGYGDQAQTPNTQLTSYVFDDGAELVVETRGRYTNGEDGVSVGLTFYGSKGYIQLDNRWNERFKLFLDGRQNPEPDFGKIEGDSQQDDYAGGHFRNFFDAVRANKREMLAAEINETYLSTVLCLLGNISYRLKRSLRFDPASRLFVGDKEAGEMLKGTYRAPFTVPDAV